MRSSLQAALATFVSRRYGHADAHLPLEALMVRRGGTWAAARTDLCRDHLTFCSMCADLVLDYGVFLECLGEGRRVLSVAQVEDDWVSLSRALSWL